MKRFLTIIAATAVAAAVTIPAVADSGSPSDETAAFESCLRAHGVPLPSDLEGAAAKAWIGDHPNTPGLEDAFKACGAHAPKHSGPAPEELRTCLAGKGLEPPASLDDLKRWILQQSGTAAGKDALKACGVAGVAEKHGGPCGGEQPEPKSPRQQPAEARTTPAT